MVLRDMV